MVATSACGRIIHEGFALLKEDPVVCVGATTGAGAFVPVETVRGSMGRLPLVNGALDAEPLRMVGAAVEIEALSSIRTRPELLGACDGELEMETVEFQPTVGEKVMYPSKEDWLVSDGVFEGAREGSWESTMRIDGTSAIGMDGVVGVVDGNAVGVWDGAFDGGADRCRVGGTVSKNASGFRVGGRVVGDRVGDLVGGGRTGANVIGLFGVGVGRRVGLRIGRGVGRRVGRLTGAVTGMLCR
jgi:hypothetical protein